MEKKYYKNLKLIVCEGKDNLIGDRTPDENSNGMLWHIKEELIYFKNKTIFIAGGYSIYKYFLDNFEIDEIFLSKIKDSVEVKKAVEPLYFPNIEDYGYKIVDKKDYEEFVAYVYKK